jgi:hypothetical protein
MEFKWRKWNRVIHRDFGYFFFAMTVIYSLSGIAINHLDDWNPNYIITFKDFQVKMPTSATKMTKSEVINMLTEIGENDNYKKHYYPEPGQMKVFLDGGNATFDMESGKGTLEKIKRRPIFHPVNFLHYNPGKWWALFSDFFAGALILIAITGLFIIRGKNGITRRGAVLTIAGIIIPVIYLILFY